MKKSLQRQRFKENTWFLHTKNSQLVGGLFSLKVFLHTKNPPTSWGGNKKLGEKNTVCHLQRNNFLKYEWIICQRVNYQSDLSLTKTVQYFFVKFYLTKSSGFSVRFYQKNYWQILISNFMQKFLKFIPAFRQMSKQKKITMLRSLFFLIIKSSKYYPPDCYCIIIIIILFWGMWFSIVEKWWWLFYNI